MFNFTLTLYGWCVLKQFSCFIGFDNNTYDLCTTHQYQGIFNTSLYSCLIITANNETTLNVNWKATGFCLWQWLFQTRCLHILHPAQELVQISLAETYNPWIICLLCIIKHARKVLSASHIWALKDQLAYLLSVTFLHYYPEYHTTNCYGDYTPS